MGNYVRTIWQRGSKTGISAFSLQRRWLNNDGRNRLSNFWTPTQNKKKSSSFTTSGDDGHDLLIRAGFLRQAHSGIFHLLPLGLRVQDKIERLIDRHMQTVGASKVSLSSLSAQDLWQKSGRLDGRNKELFQLEDRKEARWLLAPTHEEEITTIVKNAVHSYKDLPLRLYQVSRKYRDEARPRQGLLRGREFVMKDLYTFDATAKDAMETYTAVSQAYRAFFNDLNLPYHVANADSGDMGGNHSHEYHFASDKGEDTIIRCGSCNLSVNEELYIGTHLEEGQELESSAVADGNPASHQVWRGRLLPKTHTDREQAEKSTKVDHTHQKAPKTPGASVELWLPPDHSPNIHALKKLLPNLDTTTISPISIPEPPSPNDGSTITYRDPRIIHPSAPPAAPFLLTKPRPNDRCPNCSSPTLELHRAIEIGHTFHLGARYSAPLGALVQLESNTIADIEMGCHGIGVSRLIGSTASLLADSKGLNWPVAIAPYTLVIIAAPSAAKEDSDLSEDITRVYNSLTQIFSSPHSSLDDRREHRSLPLDAIIDDRVRPLGWKLHDADLIGYPFIVVLGKAWKENQEIELQCRRLGIKEHVSLERLREKLWDYIQRL